MTGQGGSLPLSGTSIVTPLPSSWGWLSLFQDSWRSMTGEPLCVSTSPTWSTWSWPLTTSPMPFLLPGASSKREHLNTKILSMLEKGAIKRVSNKSSPGFYFAVCHPQKEWEALLGNQPVVVESSPIEGEVSDGDACKSPALHPERRLGSLSGSEGCLLSHSDPHIIKKVSLFSLPGRCIPVLGSAFRLVSEPRNLHKCSG